MKSVGYGLWRALRVAVACAIGVVIVIPQDKWFSKETLAIAVGAGIAGLAKFLRDEYKFDLKLL
jgi:hypothetical protein